jgi:hypothetical protein
MIDILTWKGQTLYKEILVNRRLSKLKGDSIDLEDPADITYSEKPRAPKLRRHCCLMINGILRVTSIVTLSDP